MDKKKRHSKRLHSLFTIIIIFLLVYSAAFITGLFRADAWYKNLRKPAFIPSDVVFLVGWNILYMLIAVVIILLWKEQSERHHITVIFSTNLVLNLLWSVFFFGLHKPDFAFFDLLLLVASIIGAIVYAYNRRRAAAYLLIPYLLWILFVAYLNYQIAFFFN